MVVFLSGSILCSHIYMMISHDLLWCSVRRLPEPWWMCVSVCLSVCLLFMYDFSISFYVFQTHESFLFTSIEKYINTNREAREKKRYTKTTPSLRRIYIFLIWNALIPLSIFFSFNFHYSHFHIFSYSNGIPLLFCFFFFYSLLLKKQQQQRNNNMYSMVCICVWNGRPYVCSASMHHVGAQKKNGVLHFQVQIKWMLLVCNTLTHQVYDHSTISLQNI